MSDLVSASSAVGDATALLPWIGLGLASLLAGAVNAVAGGGTIISFPVVAALFTGPAALVTANATSTVGLWAGAVAAAWAYRDQRQAQPPWARHLLVPSIAGAALGALLVIVLPARWFEALVPWLILGAAILFTMQPRLAATAFGPPGAPATGQIGDRPVGAGVIHGWLAVLAQFLVAVYGGYFGAGIGILTLALIGGLGIADIHRANGVKNLLTMAINGTAAAVFAVASLVSAADSGPATGGGWGVSWPHAAVMAVAAVIGSLGGAHAVRRLRPAHVRCLVAAIAFALAGYYLWREYG
jgi:uncharacterized membrane protein YfcA